MPCGKVGELSDSMAVSLLLHPIPPEPRPAIKPRIDARPGRRDFAAMQDGIPWSSDLLTLAQRFGPRIAITDGDASITYAALSARAHGLARRLMAGFAERLAYFKVPGWIAFVDAIPVTATQKLQRGEIRTLAARIVT